MAEYVSILKPHTWIDPISLAEHLDIKTQKLDVSTVKAQVIIQALTWKALSGGIEGNSLSITYTAGATAGSEVVSVSGNKITVQIDDTNSLASQIKTAFDAHVAGNPGDASLLLEAILGTDAAQTVVIETALIGGTDPDSDNAAIVKKLEKLINRACSRVETFIDTSALAKCFQEDLDANNSNVIVPSHWPVKRIREIKIDFNRQFSSFTTILPENYFLRGIPSTHRNALEGEILEADMCQQILEGTVELELIGSDVVLRDDNEKFIVGRIFAGSSLGSIRITYDAGWIVGKTSSIDPDTGVTVLDFLYIPDDLEYAAMLLAEWWYFQRDRRDLGTTAKGVRGENYSKIESGMPQEISDILEPYRDIGFGQMNTPQRNMMLGGII